MHEISRFERWWLDAWPHRLRVRRKVPYFLKLSPDPFRGEVLEVGAGSGWTSRRILETFPQVELTATDLDPRTQEAYERLRKRYGRRLRVEAADLLDLPFARESFDIVVAIGVLHHIADVEKGIQQLLRVLRPGGLLGISDVNQHHVAGPLRWFFLGAEYDDAAAIGTNFTGGGLHA